MKLKISVLTGFLILATILAFSNFSNEDELSVPFDYGDCLDEYSHLQSFDNIQICRTINESFIREQDIYFSIHLTTLFIFIFLTALSWKLDYQENIKIKKR